MKDILTLVEEKLRSVREAEQALGTNSPQGLDSIDISTAKAAVSGGHKDGNKEDDQVAGKKVSIAVGALRPAQTEIIKNVAFSIAVQQLLTGEYKNADMGNIVSNDNYIMDGHHRWAGISLISPNAKVTVTKVDLPGGALVTALNLYTKGALGITKGNPGKGSVAEFTGDNFEGIISQAMKNGFEGEHPKTAEQVNKALSLIPGAEGDANVGKRIMKNNADKLPKEILPGAPERVQMPVINKNQVAKVKDALAAGQIDIEEPFSQGVKPVNESIFPLWNKIK